MEKKTNTKRKKKKNRSFVVWLIAFLVVLVVGIGYYCYREFFSHAGQAVTVVSQMEDYPYYLNSNATRIYKKYYKELEKELEDKRIDEKNYVSLLARLFAIDFYTLSNKVSNQDVGGVQFVASSLVERFRAEASDGFYKYIENNFNGKRKQDLPEIKQVDISDVKMTSYEKGEFQDSSAYQVMVSLTYVEDLDYPETVTLTFVHQNSLLVLVKVD